MFNIKKILLLFLSLNFIILSLSTSVQAAPAYFYPNTYVVTLNNVTKDEIKRIEIIYPSRYAFNYTEKQEWRYWLERTDFGYKYKQYSDEYIIPTLTTEEIDDIAKSYINIDTSSIKGYWIDSSVLKGRNCSITKFAINENIDIKYNRDNIVISYFADKNNRHYMNNMHLRIIKGDNTIIYSNSISSKLADLVDEFSTDAEWKEAEEVTKKTAYFEVDFSETKNNFKVIEYSETKNNFEVIEYSDNISDDKCIGIFIAFSIILICVYFIIKKKKYNKDK